MKHARAIRRLAGLGGAVELGRDRVVIRLPDPRLLALVARTTLLVVAILSFPWLHAAIRRAGSVAAVEPRTTDDATFLPALLRDLKGLGLLRPEDRAVFIGDAASRLPLLIESRIDPISGDRMPEIADGTLDFVLAADGLGGAAGFGFVDRALKIGGVAAVRLGSDPSESFRLPPNYRIVYIRRFGSTVVAVRKVAGPTGPAGSTGRRLLAVPVAKKEALNGLEDVALEPPARGKLGKRWKTRYLPDLMGDSLDGYPRRVFVDVGPAGRAGSEGWFRKRYPKGNRGFEMIRVDEVAEAAAAAGGGGMTEWLGRNVREEEYVVMKAEAEVVEEVVKGGAIGLVDELFLECRNQWQNGKRGEKSRRAYWECLALYGKLKDEGVAVHQWWGLR